MPGAPGIRTEIYGTSMLSLRSRSEVRTLCSDKDNIEAHGQTARLPDSKDFDTRIRIIGNVENVKDMLGRPPSEKLSFFCKATVLVLRLLNLR